MIANIFHGNNNSNSNKVKDIQQVQELLHNFFFFLFISLLFPYSLSSTTSYTEIRVFHLKSKGFISFINVYNLINQKKKNTIEK